MSKSSIQLKCSVCCNTLKRFSAIVDLEESSQASIILEAIKKRLDEYEKERGVNLINHANKYDTMKLVFKNAKNLNL